MPEAGWLKVAGVVREARRMSRERRRPKIAQAVPERRVTQSFSAPRRPKLLIFVIAYYAESTLRWVLDRVPSALFEEFDCELLIVDMWTHLSDARWAGTAM